MGKGEEEDTATPKNVGYSIITINLAVFVSIIYEKDIVCTISNLNI
jgi:hypothetical protein